MIETGDFTFASAPKTGCRWMRGVIDRCYPRPKIHGNNGLHEVGRIDGKPAISFVRDPADWIRSYYQNITAPVGNPAVDVFQECRKNEESKHIGTKFGLRLFVLFYRVTMPENSISAAFRSYDAQHRWRIEDMPNPMERFVGQPLRGLQWYETPNRIEIPDEVRQSVYEHEPELCKAFGYGGKGE